MAPDTDSPSEEPDDRAPAEEAPAPKRGCGCRRGIYRAARTTVAIVVILVAAAWFWFETGTSGEVVGDRISIILEEGLGRDVAVGRVSVWPTIPPRIVVRDIRIANLPGASSADFARVGRIEISGIIRSLVERRIDLGTIRVYDASVSIEKLPEAQGGGFNLPSWNSTGGEAPNVDIRRILLRGAAVEYVDRDAGVKLALANVESEIRPGKRLESLRALVKGGELRVVAGEIKLPPMMVDADVSADKRALTITSLGARNSALDVGARGSITFGETGVIDLAADVRADLARLRGPLGLPKERELEGRVVSTLTIRGKETLEIAGTFRSVAARYDVYKVGKIDGHFRLAGGDIEVALDEATFAGGEARVALTIPAGDADNVFEVEHRDVRVEQLLGVWGIGSSGLMGHADGKLAYRWRGKDVLAGSGEGTTEIEVARDGTTRALYAVPVEGSVRYRLAKRRLTFEPLQIETGSTSATITGGFALEGLDASIDANVHARDIRELDRITADIAHSLGEKDWKLFGIAGNGTIRAELRGKLTRPVVDARVVASGFTWAGAELGHADVDLRYDSVESRILFRRARFEADGGSITLRDGIGLPPGGEPTFSLTIDASRYSAKRALDAVGLKFPIRGMVTGGIRVTGKPSRGSVLFESLEVVDGGARASIDGMLGWTPEEKGLELECRIGMQNYPVSSVYAFFSEEGKSPIDGVVTGTMSLDGKLTELRGRGSLALRGAVLAGEPIELVSGEIEFDRGSMHVRELKARLAAGSIEGEFSYDIAAERFEYVLQSRGIDLSKLKGWPDLDETVSGMLVLTSSGAGNMKHPEIVIDARLEDARILGYEGGPDTPPSTLFVAVKPQGFTVEGSLGHLARIKGSGTVDAGTGELAGSVRAVVDAGAPVLVDLSKKYELVTSGSAALELDVRGNANDLANVSVTGRLVDVDVAAGPHRIRTPSPATFSFRGGKLELGNFQLAVDDEPFAVAGSVSFSGNRADLEVNGTLSAELLNYALPDIRMRGPINLALGAAGPLDDVKVSGTAEMRGGEIRIPDIPQPFKQVNAVLVLSERGVKIDTFNAILGTGRITAGGSIDRDAKGRSQLRVSVQGRKFSARVTPNLSIGGDCDLIVTGDIAEKLRVNGTVELDKVLYSKKVDLNKAITDLFLDRKLTIDAIAAPWQEDILLGLDVTLKPRSIAVRNNLADITGSGELRVTGTLARPVAVGRVVLDEGGTFELRDVEYRLARGTIDFQNPFRTDPYIDISAEGRYQSEYDITVNLTGTLDRLEATVTSDPPVEDLTLLTLLGGGLPQEGGSSASSTFTDARNTLVDASVGGVLSSAVPFADSVRIEGLSTDKPQVTLDKMISRELRAIVTYTLDEKGEDIEIIEWRISDNLVLQFTRDSTKDTSFIINAVDLTFRRRFAGQW
ncbi:MAG: translocation/assembly module TamB domain-containing protein [Thermoanaerobaculia bacterium]|nr:translocation/assembly module TamB domain-containing protein [Thermoanaerobaculia bacterium]